MTIGADVPEPVNTQLAALVGQALYRQVSDPVEKGAIQLFASAIGDGHPAWWGDDPHCPPALLSAWNRPLMWRPDATGHTGVVGLALHFRLKDMLGLPRAVVTASETEMGAAIRPGMQIACTQALASVSELRTNRLGTGRNWTLRVEYRCASTDAFLGAETLRFFGYGGAA